MIHTHKAVSILFNKFLNKIESLGPINLVGPNGIGKFFYVKEFIRNIECLRYTPFLYLSEDVGECNCEICKKILKNEAMDIIILNGSDKIEYIRDKIDTFVYSSPKEFDYKYLIVRNLQYFSEQSSNTFLRILEEPPKYLKIFTTCEDNVLETLLSRLKSFQCGFLDKKDIEKILTLDNRLNIYLKNLDKYDFKTLDQIFVYNIFSFEDRFKKFFMEGVDSYTLDKELLQFIQQFIENLEYKKEYILDFFIEFYIQRVREYFEFKREDTKITFFKDKFENNFIPTFSESFFKYLYKSNPFINYKNQMFIFLNLMNIFKKILGV